MPVLISMGNNFLQSKVARRIFVLFVISALAPILLLAVIYQFQVADLLVQQARSQLRAASATHVAAIYDRLVFADQSLRNAAADIARGLPIGDIRKRTATTFSSMQLEPDALRLTQSSAQHLRTSMLSTEDIGRILDGQSGLITVARASSTAKVFMVRLLDSANPAHGMLFGELNPEHLWSEQDKNAHVIEFCVFDQNNIPLSCKQGMGESSLRSILPRQVAANNADLEWKGNVEPMVGHFREIFLDAKFAIPRWFVVSGQRKVDALNSLSTFNTVFWGSLGVSALLALFLSLMQIRRTLVPLNRLIEGTSQLGKRDFSAKVEIESGDEFETLAQSFNGMTGRLGRQFDVMTTLSAIDRVILSELDMSRVVAEVLSSLRNLFQLKCAALSILDPDVAHRVQVYALSEDHDRSLSYYERVSVDASSGIAATDMSYWIDAQRLSWLALDSQGGNSANHYYCVPIASKTGTCALLSLGFSTATSLESDDIAHIRDFADRVGVALSSAVRDELLFRQARYDSLTGLPNRFMLLESLEKEVARAQGSADQFAVLYIDLDRFKQVNDSLGHAAGDLLLQEAARRLRRSVREVDTVARVGGDEFAVVISAASDEKGIRSVAEHVLRAMEPSFSIFGAEHFVTASIGIVQYPKDGISPTDLLRNADTAMYRAKSDGRSQYVLFEESMNAEVVRIATLDRELRHALAEHQFVLHYQPQIDLRNGDIVGAEALIRWRHPQRGDLLPTEFMDFAEDSGLIVAIGRFVLHEACRQFCRWQHAGIGIRRIAINVSGRQFREPGFVDLVLDVLRETGMPEHCLALEITENVVIEDIDQVSKTLAILKRNGVTIELDDFGTGYSSMSYLENLPIDTLKIDRAFIKTISADGQGGTMTRLILDMARNLNKAVVAEGVEQVAQLEFLRRLDCGVGQGFLFAKPLDSPALIEFVGKWDDGARNKFFPQPRLSLVTH